MKIRLALSVLLLALLALYGLGCDSASNPIAPTGSTLSLTASPAFISLNGQSAVLTITGFRPDGNPLNPNTQLNLSTTLGVLRTSNSIGGQAANIVVVDDAGRAMAYLFGDGRQGTATVTVGLTTGADATTATVDVQIGDDANSKPQVTVTANPAAIALNDSSTITVTAKQADGAPFVGGTAVVRTSLGSLSFDGGNVTDSDGIVTLTLTSNQSGAAEVTATVGSSDEAMATVEIGTTRKPTVTINANPSTVDVGDTSTITVTARDENGNLLDAVDAFMTANLGSLSGANYSTSSGILTLSGGRGEVTYTAEGPPGDNGSVTAFVQNSDIASAAIVVRGTPAVVTLSLSSTQITNRAEPAAITLTATVQDADGQPLTGELVFFQIDEATVPGLVEPNTGAPTGTGGVATATLSFDNAIPNDITSFNITARARDVLSEPRLVTVATSGQ